MHTEMTKARINDLDEHSTGLNSLSILSKMTDELKDFHPLVKKNLSYHELRKLPISSYKDWDKNIQKQQQIHQKQQKQ